MDNKFDFKSIAANFALYGDLVSVAPYGNGHINDTFVVVFNQCGTTVRYILQRINTTIFKDPVGLIANIKGVAHNLDFSNSNVVYIKPFDSEDLGAAFDFDPELNKKRMTLGYLDAKKAFGELKGNIYHFLPHVFKSFIITHGADEVYQLELLANKLGVAKGEIYSQESFLLKVITAFQLQLNIFRKSLTPSL